MNRIVHRIAWIAWMILLALLLPALATAQSCAVAPGSGSEIRFDAGRRTITGEILALDGDSVRVAHSGVVQTLDRAETLSRAEVLCEFAEPGRRDVLSDMATWGTLGAALGLVVGEITRGPAPPPETREFCLFWSCSTYQTDPPRPPPAFGWKEGLGTGLAFGLIRSLLRDTDRGWIPLDALGTGVQVRPVVERNPVEPGAWSLGVRLPLGSR